LNPFAAEAADWVSDHAVDIASAIGALLYVRHRRRQLRKPKAIISRETGELFFNGLALVPLFLLATGAFSSTALAMVLKTSRITLAAAGVFALLAILEDRSPRRRSQKAQKS